MQPIGRETANITKSDDTTYTTPYDGFQVDAEGDVKITDWDGNAVTIPSCLAGVPYSFQFTKFWSTGTAAGISTILAYRFNKTD